jgi:hypothetical protein
MNLTYSQEVTPWRNCSKCAYHILLLEGGKTMNSLRLYLLGFFSLLLVGCATMGDLRPGSGSTFEVRNKSYNEVGVRG